ncbi:MAG: CARDB domain-containing protein [Chitinophagaceae bacterium]
MQKIIAIMVCWCCFFIAAAQPNIIRAEYYIDTDPGFGNATSISIPTSPATNDINTGSFPVTISALPVGIHALYLRSQDATGAWSVTNRQFFYKPKAAAPTAANITRAEYFFDTDPGFGLGQDVSLPNTTSANLLNVGFTASISALPVGIHVLYLRSQDANGGWSISNLQFFYKPSTNTGAASNIVKAEYFFDADPGFGLGQDITLPNTTSINLASVNFTPNIAALPSGIHALYLRSKNASGAWSVTNQQFFYKPAVNNPTAPNITKAEYFIDADPGFGNGVNLPVTAGSNIADAGAMIDISAITPGTSHELFIRSRDANGIWSITNVFPFTKQITSGLSNTAIAPPPVPNLTKVEYYIDTDPGLGNGNDYPVTAATSLTDLPINIDPATLTSGVHTFGIRSQDANGAWSLDNKWIFFKPYGSGGNINPPQPVPNITRLEYYIDSDPGLGNATPYSVTPSTNFSDLTLDLDPSQLTAGIHTFGIRAQDANGAWGLDNKWIFFKPFGQGGNINPPPPIPNIVQVEYYIDTDPGQGNATQITVTPDTDLSNLMLNANISGLSIGAHKIGVRARDANGAWSLANKWDFVVPNLTVTPNAITYGLKAVNSSTTVNVTLSNNGLAGQSITSVVVNAPFSTTYTPGAIPTTGTVTIPVTFNPTALLAYQDTLFINTTSGVFKVVLSGSAQAQNPQWSANTLTHNFGNKAVGTNNSYNFNITNTGNIPLTVGSYASTDPAFVVSMSGTNIPVGQYVNAQVTFNPSAIATYNGLIKLANTSNTLDTIFLQVMGSGYVQSTPPVISFPSVAPYNGTGGVNPAVGNTGIYTYSVKYVSATNLPPAAGYPKLGIDFNADGDFIDPGEGVYTMSKIGTGTNYSSGENYVYSTNLNLGSNYRYQFFALDSLGNIATSVHTGLYTGPLVTTETLDLSIYANDITFSKPNPAVGETFIVSAVVHNTSPYAASNVPIRFYKDSVYLTSGSIPYIAPNSTATITQPFNFSPDGFYPIKVWIDSSNTLGEVQVLNNYAIRPIIVGNFSIPGEILITSNTTTYTCYNRVYISGTAVYNGLNLVGNPPVLGATVTVDVPGVGTLTTNTITGGFWSVSYNAGNSNVGLFNCATPYNYTVSVTDYTLTKTINGAPFSFPCVTCTYVPPSPYYYISYNTTSCPLDNQTYTQSFSLINGTAPSYKDTVRVYADNVIAYEYARDSIGLGQTASFVSSFTQPTGTHALKYVHKYTSTISGTTFDSSTYNLAVYVQPNLPDLSWYAAPFQTGVRSFSIGLYNNPCVPAGASKVFLYDSMPGNPSYALIDSFDAPPIAANGVYGINYTRPSWVAGYHYLKLVADVYGQVAERDETNNIYRGLVYVPFPELSGVITGVSNPAITGGTPVNFTATIYNNGADAQSFKVQFLIDGSPLGNKVGLASLAGNTNVNIVSPIYIAPADSCPHTISMIVDVDNEVVELNETNNTSTYVLGIDIKQPTEICCLVGQNYPFQFQKDVPGNFFGWVYNKGTRNAANVRMKYTYNGNVLGYDFVNPLNAGEYKATGNFNYTFTSPGLKTIRVDFDYPDELCETDETNNVGYINVYVNQDLPNLRILSEYISPSLLNPNPGQTVNVVATVKNTGTGSAAPTKMRFYYNDGPGYVQLGNDVQINLLLPGRDTTVAATATFAPGSVGLKIIKVGVDVLGEIVETSEVDNEATRSIISGAAPDFAKSLHEGITFNPTGFAAGDSVIIRDYLRNYGGAAGTAWLRIYVKDSLHNTVGLDSVLFSINGVDSAVITKKMRINVSMGYIVTEIVRSSPPEFNEFNNTDSVMFTAVYAVPITTTVPGNLDLKQGNPLFPGWIGGRLVLGNANLNVNGIVVNIDSVHHIVTTGTGRLRLVNNNPTNLFPVSTGLTSPNFMTIRNTGVADNFAVSVIDSVNNFSGGKRTSGFVNKTWNITEDIPGGSDAKITVTWKASEELPGFNRNACGIVHYENGAWALRSVGPAVDNGDGTFSRSDSGFTSFSPFSVANPGASLPIQWLLVNGVLNAQNQAQVTWRVQEVRVRNYEIEKSFNGVDFVLLQTVNSAGDGIHDYGIVDNNLLKGIAYYRVKQTDLDGRFSYSTIVKISNTGVKELITIYPNPVKRELFVNGIIQKANVRLLGPDGKLLYTSDVENRNIAIDMSHFASGVYMLQVANEKETLVYKVVKE